jgi:hypothetical protein
MHLQFASRKGWRAAAGVQCHIWNFPSGRLLRIHDGADYNNRRNGYPELTRLAAISESPPVFACDADNWYLRGVLRPVEAKAAKTALARHHRCLGIGVYLCGHAWRLYGFFSR